MNSERNLVIVKLMHRLQNDVESLNLQVNLGIIDNVLIPMGISVADRAAMLGHSIETNLKYYSYAQKDYLEDVKAKLDAMGSATQETPSGHPKIVPFAKKESPEHLNYQAF